MSMKPKRYECLMEPTGTWMVWDAVDRLPAQYMRNTLVGLPRDKALLLCGLLNAVAADDRFRSLAS